MDNEIDNAKKDNTGQITNMNDFINYLKTLSNDELIREMKAYGIKFKKNIKPINEFYSSLDTLCATENYYKIMTGKIFIISDSQNFEKIVYVFNLKELKVSRYVLKNTISLQFVNDENIVNFMAKYLTFGGDYSDYIIKSYTEFYE